MCGGTSNIMVYNIAKGGTIRTSQQTKTSMLDDSTNGNVVKRRFVESFFQIWVNPSKRKFRLACIRHRVDSGPLRPHGKGFQDLATPKLQNYKKQWRKCARKRGHAKKCNTLMRLSSNRNICFMHLVQDLILVPLTAWSFLRFHDSISKSAIHPELSAACQDTRVWRDWSLVSPWFPGPNT